MTTVCPLVRPSAVSPITSTLARFRPEFETCIEALASRPRVSVAAA